MVLELKFQREGGVKHVDNASVETRTVLEIFIVIIKF